MAQMAKMRRTRPKATMMIVTPGLGPAMTLAVAVRKRLPSRRHSRSHQTLVKVAVMPECHVEQVKLEGGKQTEGDVRRRNIDANQATQQGPAGSHAILLRKYSKGETLTSAISTISTSPCCRDRE